MIIYHGENLNEYIQNLLDVLFLLPDGKNASNLDDFTLSPHDCVVYIIVKSPGRF